MKRRLPFFETPSDRGGGGGGPQPDWETRAKNAEHELEKVRRESAGYRTGNKGQVAEAARALAGLAGIELSTDKAPDLQAMVTQLGVQLQQHSAENRESKIQAALSDAIHERGMNPRLTRAFLREEGVLQKLDPSKADFEEQIESALDDAIDQEPALKGTSTAPRVVGADFHGAGDPSGYGPGASGYTREELSAMRPEDVVRLRKAGRLNHLLPGSR
jgi:hypothetical protein